MTDKKTCPICTAEFECTNNEQCWCSDFAKIIPLPDKDNEEGCVCPNCLRVRLELELGLDKVE